MSGASVKIDNTQLNPDNNGQQISDRRLTGTVSKIDWKFCRSLKLTHLLFFKVIFFNNKPETSGTVHLTAERKEAPGKT